MILELLRLACVLVIGFMLGFKLGLRRVARLGVCFEHLVTHNCSESKAKYIIENARLMFSRYGS